LGGLGIKFSEIMDRDVFAEGEKIGEIKGLFIDEQ
jgi:hypothetical protein